MGNKNKRSKQGSSKVSQNGSNGVNTKNNRSLKNSLPNIVKNSSKPKKNINPDVYEFGNSSSDDNGKKNRSTKKRRFDYGLDEDGGDTLSKYTYDPEHDDEEIDSDEAFGDSDDEKFDSFSFGASKKGNSKKSANESESEYSDDDEYSSQGMFLSESVPNDSENSSENKKSKVSFKDLTTADSEDEFQGFEDQNDDSNYDSENSDSQDDFLEVFEDPSIQKNIEAPYIDKSQEKKSHSKLLASLGVDMNKNKPAYTVEKSELVDESEFNLGAVKPQENTTRIDLSDVLGSISKNKTLSSIKSKLQESDALVKEKSNKLGPLTAPLPKRIQEKFDRSAAYTVTKKEVEDWQPIVTQNRSADHLQFPLNQQKVDPHKGAFTSNNFSISDGLEKDIDNILKQSGIEEESLRKYEELELAKENKEQVFARKAELRAIRELLFRQEQKAKRVSKIKSKSYRRILKKERLRNEQKNRELGGSDGLSDLDGDEEDDDMDSQSKKEQKRALERMTLRHKGAGKWAKSMQKFGKHNEEVRNSLHEQFEQHEELKKKINEQSEGSDDDESNTNYGGGSGNTAESMINEIDELVHDKGGIDEETNKLLLNSGSSNLFKMKFMQTGSKLRSEEVKQEALRLKRELMAHTGGLDGDEVEDEMPVSGRRTFGKPAASDGGSGTVMLSAINTPVIDSGNNDYDDDGDDAISVDGTAKGTNRADKKGLGNAMKAKVANANTRSLSTSDDQVDGSSNPWLGSNSANGDVMVKQTFDYALTEDSKRVDKASTKLRKAKLAAANAAALSETKAADIKFRDSKVMINEDFEKINLSVDVSNAPKAKAASKAYSVSMVTGKVVASSGGQGKVSTALKDAEGKSATESAMVLGENSGEPAAGKKKRNKKKKNKAGDAESVAAKIEADRDEETDDEIERNAVEPTQVFTQKELIERAFAADAGVFEEEFKSEKQSMIEREFNDSAKGKQLAGTELLPGWGSWGGTNASEVRMSKFAAKKDEEKRREIERLEKRRKDAKLGDVIISQKQMKSLNNYKVDKVPFPYVSQTHYQNSLNLPVGPEWNTASAVGKITKPRIITKMGKIIDPISKPK
ncbi:U3 small nucleolar RNA-associated protein 14 [Smittium culicis]|uniref:U3 small nucleolar RNA-associated protein 14 n=1 Tax=Smittium culicis TaxID=133412 RepID=A0A1R1YGF3_9FUNG|nr:U3 small nucleolar RNA-associated protein 14 [Smittium culicis]